MSSVDICVWHTIKNGQSQRNRVDRYEPPHIWYQNWDVRQSAPGIEDEHAAVNDGTSARVDARKSRDALERTVSITACCTRALLRLERTMNSFCH